MRQHRAALALLHVGFLLSGIVNALLGPLLPILQSRFHATDAELGTLFVAQFAGASLGGLVSQWRPRVSIVGGYALVAVGLVALAVSPWSAVVLTVFVFGFGLGAAIPATNMTVAYAESDRRAASLNILNLIWGAGATGSALIVAVLMRYLHFSGTLVSIAAAATAIAIALLFSRIPATYPAEESRSSDSSHATGRMLLYCFLLFLYIGVEGCVGGWAGQYAESMASRRIYVTASLVTFWGAILAGRAVAAIVLRYISESRLFRVSLLTTGAGLILFFAAKTGVVVVLASLIAGLGLAPIFALQLSLMSRYAESASVHIPGWLFSLGSMGGGALPWLFGVTSSAAGSLRLGFFVPALGTITLMFCVVREGRLNRI
jgi:fucose permease